MTHSTTFTFLAQFFSLSALPRCLSKKNKLQNQPCSVVSKARKSIANQLHRIKGQVNAQFSFPGHQRHLHVLALGLTFSAIQIKTGFFPFANQEKGLSCVSPEVFWPFRGTASTSRGSCSWGYHNDLTKDLFLQHYQSLPLCDKM